MFKKRTACIVHYFILLFLALPLFAAGFAFFPDSIHELRQVIGVIDKVALQRFFNSTCIGICAAFFAVLWAMPVFWLYLHLPLHTRRWLFPFSLMPLSYPPYGIASAWMTLIAVWEQGTKGRILWTDESWISHFLYSVPGCGFILSLCYWPVVFLILTLTARLTRVQFETASLYLNRWQKARYVYWPAWKEPILIAGSLLFCLGMVQFEVPSLLQVSVYPLEIFIRFTSFLNEGQAFFLCVLYIPIVFLLGWCTFRIARYMQSRGGEEFVIRLSPLGLSLTGVSVFFVLLFSLLVPIIGLCSHIESIRSAFHVIWKDFPRIFRSVLLSGTGATVIVTLGLLFVASRTERNQLFDFGFILLLFVLPGVLIAAGWLHLRSLWPGMLPWFVALDTMLFAYTAHYFIFGYISGILLWKLYGEDQWKYDSLLSLSWFQKMRFLYFPALRYPFLQAVIIVSLFLWGEVGMTILLHPPGSDTLAVEYFNLLHYGSEPRTAAIGLVLLGLPAVGMMMVVMTIWKNRRTSI